MIFAYRLVAPLAFVLLLIAGCGPAVTEEPAINEIVTPAAAVEATAAPIPSDTPAAPVAAEPTAAAQPVATVQPVAEPAPTATPEPETDWTQTAALVDGLYVRGNPEAPIRLIDYSDFF